MLTSTQGRPPRRSRRAGLTLVELLVVIVLLGVVAGGMLGIINRQQRFYTGSAGVIDTRSNVRQGLNVLQSELRALSPTGQPSLAGSDILAMGSTFIEFRAGEGASVICAIDPTRKVIVIPPAQTLSSGTTLTAWAAVPQTGEQLFVYDFGADSPSADDQWDLDTLAAAPTKGGACANAGAFTQTNLLLTAVGAANGWTLTLQRALPGSVALGAAIRFVRQVRYELYQEGDGKWYLGYKDCVPNRNPVCTALQPVAGPYLAATASSPGLTFSYFDGNGVATATPANVRRVDIVMRAQSTVSVDAPGRPAGQYVDSLSTSVALRN